MSESKSIPIVKCDDWGKVSIRKWKLWNFPSKIIMRKNYGEQIILCLESPASAGRISLHLCYVWFLVCNQFWSIQRVDAGNFKYVWSVSVYDWLTNFSGLL